MKRSFWHIMAVASLLVPIHFGSQRALVADPLRGLPPGPTDYRRLNGGYHYVDARKSPAVCALSEQVASLPFPGDVFVVQRSLRRVPTALAWGKKVILVSLWDALERVFDARLFPVDDDTYWGFGTSASVMRELEQEVRIQQRAEPEQASRVWESTRVLRSLMRTFSRETWQRLLQGNRLSASDLTDEQRVLLDRALHLRAFAESDVPPGPAAFAGAVQCEAQRMGRSPVTSLHVRWSWPLSPNDLPPGDRKVWIPCLLQQDGTFRPRGGGCDMMSAENIVQSGYRIPAPRLLKYREHPQAGDRLEVPPGRQSWDTVFDTLHRQLGVSLAAQGSWLRRPLPPSLTERRIGDILASIETVAQGRWEEVGPFWVLTPNSVRVKARRSQPVSEPSAEP